METNRIRNHSSNMVLEEDIFAETLYSPVMLNHSDPLQVIHDSGCSNTLICDTIKTEPEEDIEQCNYYLEVSMNEGMEMQFESDPLKLEQESQPDTSDLGDPSLLKKSFVTSKTVSRLIKQHKGRLSELEVRRSVGCFVPIIPVDGSPITIKNGDRRSRRSNKNRKSEVPYAPKRLKSQTVSKLGSGLKLKIKKTYQPVLRQTQTIEKLVKIKKENETPIRRKKRNEKIASCSECSKKFKNEKALSTHLIPVENTETMCTDCELDLKHPNCLKYHRRKIHGDVPIATTKEEKVEPKEEDTTNTSGGSSRVCEICNKTFRRVAGLVYHRRQVHKLGKSLEKKFSCKMCEKSFIQRSQLATHERAHKTKTDENSDIIEDEKYAPEEDEIKRVTTGSSPACEICGKVFTRSSGLIYHRRQVHHLGQSVERKFSCTICDKTFLKKSHLILHGQSHTGLKLFQCRFCQRAFGGTTGRRLHEEKVHGGSGANLSPEQIAKNQAEAALKAIEEPISAAPRIKGRPPQTFPCSFCPKIFARPSAKKVHERSHTGEKPFLCVICGNSYKSSIALREHEKTSHTHTLDLLCTICGAAFGRQMSLKYHILSRHSDKKYKCQEEGCGRSFVQRAKLERHTRIHSKGFQQCHICNRTLQSVDQLERHLRIHELRKMKQSGVAGIVVPRFTKPTRPKLPPKPRRERKTPAPIRKLQCGYCEKRFPYQNELDKHEKAVHLDQRDFKCTIDQCPKAFISNYKLLNHMKSAHGREIDTPLLAMVTCDICGKECQGIARLGIHKNSRHYAGAPKVRPRVTTSNNAQKRRRSKDSIDEMRLQNSVINSIREVSAAAMNNRQVTLPPTTQSYPLQQPIPRQSHMGINSLISEHQLTTVSHHIRSSNSYLPQAHEQIPFFSFNHSFPTLQPPEFPYSSGGNFIPPPFHQGHFDFPNPPNNWQAHQHRQPHSHVYQPQIPQPRSRNIEALRDDYSSSDYSDLIHIPPQDDEYPHDVNDYTDDNDNYSTSNAADEDYQPAPQPEPEPEPEPVVPKKGRGRPRKDSISGNTLRPKPYRKRAPRPKPLFRKPKPKKQLPCPICSKTLSTNQHLREHIKIHERREREKELEYKCKVCGKTFTRAHHLRVHSVIHDPSIRPFTCNQPGCGAEFRAPADFRKHRDSHSLKTEKIYRCKFCKVEKPTSGELDIHNKEVHADRMCKCEYPGCNFICLTMSRLHRHSEQHLDKGERVRPYKCNLCDCSYIRGENLQQHLDTSHQGAGSSTSPSTTFPCPKCPKAFEFDWKLKTHLRKTHGGKRRKCPTTFISRKPLFYYCEDCDWSFSDAASLRNHIKSKHKGTSIPCLKQPCDKKYFYVNTLEHHISTQHEPLSPEEELKLIELRKSHPLEPEPVEVKIPKQKSARKSTSPRKKPKVKEEETDVESIYSEEEGDLDVKVKEMPKRQQPPRSRRIVTKSQEYVESSDEEDSS